MENMFQFHVGLGLTIWEIFMAEDRTVAERIRIEFENLTRAERQLTNAILDNYPMSGLGGVTSLAEAASVSTPTVVRLAKKLGFRGFPQMQAQLRAEVEETLSDPIAKHERWNRDVPDTHLLNRFTDAVVQNLRQTLANIDPDAFDGACALLADPEHAVYIAGGRITGSLADYFFKHLQMVRPGVQLIPQSASVWPHYVLDMKAGDTLAIFDIRRYENDNLKLARLAAERGARIILFTDQWGSPIAKHAAHTFNCRIEVPSAWDSNAVVLVVVETMIAKIQDANWKTTRKRTRDLENLFDSTGLFRKFK